MSIKEILKKYSTIEIELLLSKILGKPREFLYLHPNLSLSAYQLIRLRAMAKRRQKGEPIAYILGYKDFMGLRFKVNKNVLIPRPETEEMVERILMKHEARSMEHKAGVKILDIGTGSGCIAISLAKQFSMFNFQYSIFASDISKQALSVAKYNAKMHKVKIKFIQSNLFQNIQGKFHIIVANLPYVPVKHMRKFVLNKVDSSPFSAYAALKFEPPHALTDGTSTWQIYKQFFQQVGSHLNDTGVIWLEIDPGSRKVLAEYIKKYLPSWKIKFYKDYRNFWRFAEIRKPEPM